MKDHVGKLLAVGDKIVYARKSSCGMWLMPATVLQVGDEAVQVQPTRSRFKWMPTLPKPVWLRHPEYIVKL